ncbi:MAG: lipopolysaccharide heptosyltransferase II [Verrucomicrobiota bacterium]
MDLLSGGREFGLIVSPDMTDRLVYVLALAAVNIVRRLPLSACFLLGQAVGALMWLILPGYRRLARENLTLAFAGEKSAPAIRALTFKHFTTLGANAVCAFKIPAVEQEDIQKIAVIENLDRIRTNLANGRPVVLAINHIGNWELYAQLVFQVPEARFGTVYQSLRNALVDDLVNRDRRRLGVATFDRKKGFNAAIALLREPGIVGVLVDQNAGDAGIWTPFFNRLCSTSPLAATLAMRTDAAVIPVAIYTDGFARWKVVLSEEIPWSPEKPEKLTADINAALERQIRVSPQDWFWVHNRWKMPWPNFLTATAKRGTFLPPDSNALQPFRIVLRSPNWLGDAVMCLEAARAFKTSRPDVRLAVLAPAKLAGLWRRIPEVDEVVEFSKEDSVFSVARKLRGRFDAAVLFTNSFRSALEVWLAKIPRRVGFEGHFRKSLLNQLIPQPKKKPRQPEHHADRYWRIAARCGAVTPPPLSPQWNPPKNEIVIGLCPGAEYGPAKRWPAKRFREVIERINQFAACRWVVLGTAADTELAQSLSAGFPNVSDLTGKTTLEELMATLCSLSALLTNDTGTMHLADFLGVPLVAVFGSTEPAFTGPRGPRSRVIRHQVECSPCFLRDCPLDFRCMNEVSTVAVTEALEEFLSLSREAT